jgi:hypothetical protein
MVEQTPVNQGEAGGGGGNPVSGFAGLAGLVLIGYLAYSAFAGSDRSEIRACIEAAQRMDGNGSLAVTYAQQLRQLDRAKEVKITGRPSRVTGLLALEYSIDRKWGIVLCPA